MNNPSPNMQRWLLFAMATMVLLSSKGFAGEFDVLPKPNGPVRMLQDYLRPQMHAALDARLAKYEQLETAEQIAAYQGRLRSEFIKSLGGFPERTPLNSKIVGVVEGDDYRIENVIYESRPGFHVPANFYLPNGKSPFPGVLIPCGHSKTGKAAYQRIGILLAKNGIAALCYDAIGQGERKQILQHHDDGSPSSQGRFGPTTEHSLVGVPAILLGENLATYRVWDGMRSIDYLAGRPEVDAARIGCTGNSGGGMMTSYLMSLDDRIVAAAPSCFMTTSRQKNEKPGPGDAEQNIFGQLAYGLDHPDFILMRAPKPTLICAATLDFVPIDGTWQAFRQAKRLYTRMGYPEQVDLVEADAKHGFSLHLREGATHWMRRWFAGNTETVRETEFKVHPEKEVQCTPQGQVLLLDNARSIHDLLQEKGHQLEAERKISWKRLNKKGRAELVRRVAGIRPLAEIPRAAAEQRVLQNQPASKNRDFHIKKFSHRPLDGIELPILLFEPSENVRALTLYLHGEGKAIDAGPNGPIEKLVAKGHLVMAVDLRGYGETATTPWRFGKEYFGNNGAEYFIAYMLGRSLVGMRAEDVLVSARILQGEVDRSMPIHVIAIGRATIPAMHAVAAEPELFGTIQLRKSISSWQQVLDVPVAVDQLENTIHGVLANYDLPDLIEEIGAERVTIEEAVDATGGLAE